MVNGYVHSAQVIPINYLEYLSRLSLWRRRLGFAALFFIPFVSRSIKMDNIKRKQNERIDVNRNIRPMSCNMPGHEKRMKVHCKRIQREYLDFRGKYGRLTKVYRDKRSRD